MKLRTIGRAIVRRWYVFVGGLLAVAGLAYALYGAVPVDYKATASVVLLPASSSVGAGGNPYLFLGGLSQAMDVLTRRLSAPDLSEQMIRAHAPSSYTVAPDVTSGSSIILVTVKARSGADASAVLAAVLADIPSELTSMQDELKVPNASRISSMQVAPSSTPTVDAKPRIQTVAAASVAGVVGVLALTALTDGLLLRRRARRLVKAEAPAGHGPDQNSKILSVATFEAEEDEQDMTAIEEPTGWRRRVLR